MCEKGRGVRWTEREKELENPVLSVVEELMKNLLSCFPYVIRKRKLTPFCPESLSFPKVSQLYLQSNIPLF